MTEGIRRESYTNISPANMAEGAVGSPATGPTHRDGVASTAAPAPARKRIPMSAPNLRLEVPEIPGYRLYWHKESNVQRAMDAGYELVHRREATLNRRDIGGYGEMGGNTDLGSNVSIVHGQDQGGRPERLVLMKLPLDFFRDDQMDIALRNASRLADIFDGEQIIGPDGAINERGALVYTPSEGANYGARGRQEFKPVFNRPKRVAFTGRRRYSN